MLASRRNEMLETQAQLQQEVLTIAQFNPDQPKSHHELLQKRLFYKNPPTRAYFVRKVAEYITGKTWDKKAVKYALLAELNVTCTYLENQILDGKYGVRSHDAIKHNLIYTKILSGEVKQYIRQTFQGEEKHEVLELMDNVYHCNIIGEELNKFHLTDYQTFEKNQASCYCYSVELDQLVNVEELMQPLMAQSIVQQLAHQNFLRLYITRSYLVSAALFELFAKQLIHIYGNEKRDYTALIKFARHYGVMMQLINDTADFVPSRYDQKTPAKLAEDAFSDMCDRHITFPIIYYFNQASVAPRIKNFFKSHHEWMHIQGMENQFMILKELQVSKAIGKSMKTVAKLADYTKNLLDPDQRGIAELNDLLSFAYGNRYYKLLNNINAEKELNEIQKGPKPIQSRKIQISKRTTRMNRVRKRRQAS